MPQRQFDFLTAGDHLCLIYHTDKERFYSAILFILDGLRKGEIVVAIDEDVKDLLKEFIDIEYSVSRGQLVFLDASSYDFDYRRLIDELKKIEAEVAEKGFKGLRYLINFDPVSEENVLEYESELIHWGKGIALCMFDEEKFGYETLAKLLMVHPKLIIRKKTVENLFCPTPSNFILGKEIGEKDYSLLIKRIVELHETTRELEQLRERYRAIYSSISDGIFTLKGDTIVEVSKRFATMLGLQPSEILGKRLQDLSPGKQPDGKNSKDKAAEVTRESMEKGNHLFVWRFKKGDGFLDAEISLVKFRLDGEDHLFGVARDVSN
ncbi:MAG: MEDS domain-containing protein [Archaeoglobus sp.]|nr:MEDS domain-containing protein [Archaeoglobus sp.]